MSNDKNISFYFNGNLSPELTARLTELVEIEAKAYLESPEGKGEVQRLVIDTIKREIDCKFSYTVGSDHPTWKRFREIVTQNFLEALKKSVGG